MIIIPTPQTPDYREYMKLVQLKKLARSTLKWACCRTGFPELNNSIIDELLGELPPYRYSTWWSPVYRGNYEGEKRYLREVIRMLRANPSALSSFGEGNANLNPLMQNQISTSRESAMHGLDMEAEDYELREGEIVASGSLWWIRADNEWQGVEGVAPRRWLMGMESHDYAQLSIVLPPLNEMWHTGPFVEWSDAMERSVEESPTDFIVIDDLEIGHRESPIERLSSHILEQMVESVGGLGEGGERLDSFRLAENQSRQNLMGRFLWRTPLSFSRLFGGLDEEEGTPDNETLQQMGAGSPHPPARLPFAPDEDSGDTYEQLAKDIDDLLEDNDESDD